MCIRDSKKIGGRLRAFMGLIHQRNLGSHVFADRQKSCPGRIDAHIFNQHLGIGQDQRGGNEIYG